MFLESRRKKIKAMQNAAVFRRKIICKEWEWEVLKMKIEEKEQFIKLIEKCKVSLYFKFCTIMHSKVAKGLAYVLVFVIIAHIKVQYL